MGLRKKLVDIQYGRAEDPHDWIRKGPVTGGGIIPLLLQEIT
jgi:hypothetical protein